MRIYVVGSEGHWWAHAGDVPGTASEDVSDKDEAIARCRAYASEELEAYAQLGFPLDASAEAEVIEWKMPWWMIPDWLVPVSPALRDAVVRRIEDVAADLDRHLDALDRAAWDVAPEGGWTTRRVVDHVAGGFEIGLRRLDPWPLDPARGQKVALDDLARQLQRFIGKGFAAEHAGMNQEAGRVRWTPRKVVRAVRHLQEEVAAYYGGGTGAQPNATRGHGDRADDDEPITAEHISEIVDADGVLQGIARRDRRARSIAISYRYYRDRLVEWPVDARERLRAMRLTFTDRLMRLDETSLALVRQAPTGQCTTVRMEFGLGLSHVREHLAQMRAVAPQPA